MRSGEAPTRRLNLETVDSTNREAERLFRSGEAGPIWIIAMEQVRGRGRSGRNWVSPPGNLYVTYLFPFTGGMSDAPKLGFVAALAIADAIATLTPGAQTELKWPNDCLLNGKKVSGILPENLGSFPDGTRAIALGMGINLAQAPEASATRWPATCLAVETGQPADIEAAFSLLAGRLDHWLGRFDAEGFEPVRDAWKSRAAHLGQSILVNDPKGPLDGVFLDLDVEGALLLQTDEGVRRITAGDVMFGEGGDAAGD